MLQKFKPEDLLDINMLNPRAQQSRFQTAYLEFLHKNKFSFNCMEAGLSIMIMISAVLSLLSFWIPFSIATVFLVRSLFKANDASLKNLNSFDKKFLDFMKTTTVFQRQIDSYDGQKND